MFELILIAATFADVPVGMAFAEKTVAPVGEWCEECTPGGKPLFPNKPGHVGDGRVFSVCGACNGTQKRQAPAAAPAPAAAAAPAAACEGGACGTTTTTQRTYVRRGILGRRR